MEWGLKIEQTLITMKYQYLSENNTTFPPPPPQTVPFSNFPVNVP
jgi:hypothetical protein